MSSMAKGQGDEHPTYALEGHVTLNFFLLVVASAATTTVTVIIITLFDYLCQCESCNSSPN